ncbi:GNAT family N-acetyltransferase [Actinopolymorpha sp. NPDC004070]|uniref:GNAT family N-acetyltransferase n=1 Tax=Actinopolymorpha sp. NPDC004070 TaxID=3154548 RepID=UPI0033A532A1
MGVSRHARTRTLAGRGIGTALMRTAEERTTAARACLFVRPRNEAVLAFYRRLGYAPPDGAAIDTAQELVGLAKELSLQP